MKYMVNLVFIVTLVISSPASALNVVATYPWIGDLAKKVGGDALLVDVLASGDWDPHYIVARPSLISKIRRADVLLANGADLEVGWLPALTRKANNRKILPGSKGFVDLSSYIDLIEKPEGKLSRAKGDVHPNGNPHYALDPENIVMLAEAVAKNFCEVDNERCSEYKTNATRFTNEWKENLKKLEKKMAPLMGSKVIEYHTIFNYFFKRYNVQVIGVIEPLPGLPPTGKHTEKLLGKIRRASPAFIAVDVYHSSDAANYLSSKTGTRVVTIPHDVGSVEGANDLYTLFDTIVERVTNDD